MFYKSFFSTIFLCILVSLSSNAQIINDDCDFAFDLGNIYLYCSGETEFSNVEATSSGETEPICWFGGSSNDMWFTFTPTAPGIYIQVLGNTLNNPSVVVYEGNCSNLVELACESKENNKIAELTLTSLNIGQEYILRIDARENLVGDFQLCLESFIPVPSPQSDCKDAVILCNKDPFIIENLNQVGDIPNELEGPCVGPGNSKEKASVWYVWTCDQPGSLTFTLTPNNPNSEEEDLDFVVYELPDGINDCENKNALRCMLSGETSGQTPQENAPCYGPTGLKFGETDISESPGCDKNSNNFVAPLDMEAGKSYGLIVNNYSQSGYGFAIEFGGTGTFLGPQADFEIEYQDTLNCDKLINFIDLSLSNTDEITEYLWSFGTGSTPKTATGEGPHQVTYESFGKKVAGLTITSKKGCTTTKILEFDVESCCVVNDLELSAEVIDVVCNGENNGSISIIAQNGNPNYSYSMDDINYTKNPFFNNLGEGDYLIYVTDIKGCKDSIELVINSNSFIDVDAGPDHTVNLGEAVDINAIINSSDPIDSIFWTPQTIFKTCFNCLNPNIVAPGTTTYKLTVVDVFGCQSSDEITIFVRTDRPIFFPNIFSPNGDGQNEYFNVFGNNAIESVEKLIVFDRWGNKVYEGMPQHSQPNEGWNGTFKGKDALSGTYNWVASVKFIDNVTVNYSGTITIVR